jgi:hypothetical protein
MINALTLPKGNINDWFRGRHRLWSFGLMKSVVSTNSAISVNNFDSLDKHLDFRATHPVTPNITNLLYIESYICLDHLKIVDG